MRIVITGANGFVGSALCRYFYHQGHQVIATGRQEKPNSNLLNYATYISADITNPVKPFDADICIHAAGLASDTADYHALFLNNVTGTKNVLEAAKNCRYFIFISSSSVYNFSDKPAIESDTNLNTQLNNYGKTKLLAEELVKVNIFAHQQRLILRPRAIYGVGDRILLPRMLSMIKRHTVFIPTNNTIQTSATHIENLAYAIGLFLNQRNKPVLQVFNIADDEVYSLKAMSLKILSAVEGGNLNVVPIPLAVVKAISFFNPKRVSTLAFKAITQNSILDLKNIKKSLNYNPLYTFDNSYTEIGKWINSLGGKNVYMKNLKDVPWMLNQMP